MRAIKVCAGLVCALLLALPVAAQEEAVGQLARVYVVQPKAGMALQFEEAYAAHVAWHREQGDTWTWVTWQVQSGEDFGKYAIITPGHRWADFDNPGVLPKEDAAHFLSTAGQYVESVTSSFWVSLPDISRPLESEGAAAVRWLNFFEVQRGKIDKFRNAVHKVHKAIEKTNWPANYFWAALVNGGSQPTYLLVFPRENWAGFSPQETPFDQMLEEAYGEQEAKEILSVLDRAIKSQRTHIEVYRPELSYVPGGN